MIRVNLLPVKELKAEIGRRRDLTLGGMALGGVAVLFAVVYLYQAYRMSNLNSQIAALHGEIQALNIKVKQVGDLQNKIKEFTSKNKIIEDLDKKKVGPVRVMETLSAITPQSLWLTEFKETGGHLVMNGLAVDNQTVADFLKGLAASEYFKGVELVETTEGGQKFGPYNRFSIKTNITYRPAPNTGATKRAPAASSKAERKG